MSFNEIVSDLFAIGGGLLLGLSAIKHYKLYTMIKKRSYRMKKKDTRRLVLQEILNFTFCGSYFVGMYQALTNEVDWLFFFEGAMFFACAIFFYLMLNQQYDAERTIQDHKFQILRTFVNAIDKKDAYTRGHSQHVHKIVKLLFKQLPTQTQKTINLSKLLDAALLHDIGKIGISETILKKKEPLTHEEWDEIRNHVVEGKQLLDDTFFTEISRWIFFHHERVDGNGYNKLPGDMIPIESRIIAIADTYSAITTNREYRKAASYEEAIKIMQDCAGSQLDAGLMKYFLKIPREDLLPDT